MAQRVGMSLKHKKILLNNRRELRDQLEVDKVIPVIQSVNVGENEREILDEYDVAEIKTEKTKFHKAEKLLDILPNRGERAFHEFVKALSEMQPHLGKLLSEAEETYEEASNSSKQVLVSESSTKRAVSRDGLNNDVQESQAYEETGFEYPTDTSEPPAAPEADTPTTSALSSGGGVSFSIQPLEPPNEDPSTSGTTQMTDKQTSADENLELSCFREDPGVISNVNAPTPPVDDQSDHSESPELLDPEDSETESAACDGLEEAQHAPIAGYGDEGDGPMSWFSRRSKKKGHDITDTAFGQNLQFEKNVTLVTGLEPDSFYDMKTDERGKRGKALIINNKTFTIPPYKYYERTGTDIDAQALEELFTKLLYEVIVKNNKTKNQIRDIMRKHTSETDHSRYSSFVFIVLSHGTEGKVLGTDGEIDIKELANMARDTESLIGKPKLFFIQACQGSEYMSGRDVPDGPAQLLYAKPGLPEKEQVQLPAEADFLYAYSTVPGYYSWRNQDEGSWFIQDVVKIFYKWAKSLDIVRMLTRVNKEIATRKSDANNTMQISTIVSNLRKELYFFPEEVVGAQMPPNPQQPGIQGVEDMDCVDNIPGRQIHSHNVRDDRQSSSGALQEVRTGLLSSWCQIM